MTPEQKITLRELIAKQLYEATCVSRAAEFGHDCAMFIFMTGQYNEAVKKLSDFIDTL